MTRFTGFSHAAVLLTWGFTACLLTLVNIYLGRYIHIPPFGTVAGHALALVYLAAILMALLCTARAASRMPVSTGFLLTAGGALALPILLQILSNIAKLPPTLDILAAFLPFEAQIVVSNLLAPLGMTLLGAGIGRIIKHPNTLLAGAGASIFFDIVVVTMGTVAQLMRSGSNVIAAVSVGGGGTVAAGTHAAGVHAPAAALPPPVSGVTIGPADVLFMALFLSAVYHLKLSNRTTFWWMFGLLFTALVIVETTGLPIPALAPMGIAVLVANLRHGAFTQQEKRDLRIGSAFAVFCAILMIGGAKVLIHPAKPSGDSPNKGMIGFRIGYAPTGAFAVLEVVPGSRADAAGLRPGDAVRAVNGKPIDTILKGEFDDILKNARRDGITLTVKSGDQPKPRDIVFPSLSPASSSPSPGSLHSPVPSPAPSAAGK